MTKEIEALYSLEGFKREGARSLSDMEFKGQVFDDLVIGPGISGDAAVELKNCSFIGCRVRDLFWIAPGAVVENVIFDDVSCPDVMTISTEAILDRVVVRGKRKRAMGLWVKPYEFPDEERSYLNKERAAFKKWADEGGRNIEWMLDFSGVKTGEVEVVGLPLDKLRWDPQLHVPISLRWVESPLWAGLDFSDDGFVANRLRRLRLFEVDEGVWSWPARDEDQAREEVGRLKTAGFMSRPWIHSATMDSNQSPA